MLKNNIVVIAFNLPWNWSTDYTNQTAYELSKSNLVICYMLEEMYSIKEYILKRKIPKLIVKQSKNVYIYKPLHFFPFRRLKLIFNINTRLNVLLISIYINLLKVVKKYHKVFLWVFDPAYYETYKQFSKKYLLLYDCVDYFPAVYFKTQQRQIVEKGNRDLLKTAKYVVTISHALKKLYSQFRSNISVVPQGFDVHTFKKFNKSKKISIPQIPHNQLIIGYIGALNYRLDFKLLFKLIKNNPQWTFAFFGQIQLTEDINPNVGSRLQSLFNLKNVFYGGNIKRIEIPYIIDQFDICIIPYDASLDFNRYCYPMKIFEYFYLGKPVIATHISELKQFPQFIKIGNTAAEWQIHLNSLLSKHWSKNNRTEQRNIAEQNSWKNKINNLYSIIKANT